MQNFFLGLCPQGYKWLRGFIVFFLSQRSCGKVQLIKKSVRISGGVYFEACAAGRLLLLEPTADTLTLPDIHTRTEQTLREKAEAGHRNYQPIPVSSDRYRMMAANEIVKILCP